MPMIWLNYPQFDASNIAFISHEDDAQIKVPKFTGDPEDRAMEIVLDYINFYGFQKSISKVKNLSDYMLKVPFQRYYDEHTKPYHEDPNAINRRFG